MDQAKPTTSQHARQHQQHTLHEVGHAVAHAMAPATLALAASEASTAIKQAAIPLPSAEQTAKADAERRQCWHELRNVVRQIYAEVKANNEYEEGFSISFERTYNMVYRLCKHNPETLFRKLEKEAQNWLEVLRERLVAQLSTTSVASVDRAHKFLLAVQKKYDDLCAANEVFNGVFIYLHNCFLKQFDITFADVNKGLFWETVYLDPILQINLPRLKSQLKRSDPVLQQYMNFEKKLKETRSRWRQLKKRLDQYTLEKQREARLRAECQQLQRRWQKLEEQHRAGEIPDIDPEAIAEHIHSCPFCFHQHLSAMTKKGEDCCAAHTNTRHVVAGAAAASVDFVGHAAAAAGVNPYHNPCCSASCVYGDPMASGHSMYSTGEELDDDEDDDEDDEGEELDDDDEDDEDEYETSIPASAAIPHCQAPGHNTCGTDPRNGKTKHAGHCCCLHSHYLMCDHFAESTREKLRSKLSIRSHVTNGMGSHAGGMGRDVKAQSPPRPVEDQRSLDELLSFINNTKKTPARGGGGGKSDDRSSSSSASTLASSSASAGGGGTSSSAKARKKQRKRERRQREREEKEREEREAKLNQQSQLQPPQANNNGGSGGGGKPKAAKAAATAAPEDNGGGDGPEDNSSNGPAVPPDEPSEASASVAAEAAEVVAPGGSRLAAKLAQFTEFPQFWEEEDDLDPDLKAEQDREVEEFRRRLEASGGLAQRQQKKQLNDDNAVELSQLCQSQISMKKVTTTQRWNGMNWVLGQSLVPPQPTTTTSSPSSAATAVQPSSASSSSPSTGGQRRTNNSNSNAGGGGGGKGSRGKGKRTKRNGGARARP